MLSVRERVAGYELGLEVWFEPTHLLMKLDKIKWVSNKRHHRWRCLDYNIKDLYMKWVNDFVIEKMMHFETDW